MRPLNGKTFFCHSHSSESHQSDIEADGKGKAKLHQGQKRNFFARPNRLTKGERKLFSPSQLHGLPQTDLASIGRTEDQCPALLLVPLEHPLLDDLGVLAGVPLLSAQAHHLVEDEGVLPEGGEDEADAGGDPELERGLLARHGDALTGNKKDRGLDLNFDGNLLVFFKYKIICFLLKDGCSNSS